ncbi:hypothetical protein BV25DRAFT_1774201, partial [Artomyces pyxidatus]
YLYKKFKAKKKEDGQIIDRVAVEFTLNEEQERAFRIIANHSVDEGAQQLKMYIGGMAGTGKSQVIKALTSLFEQRGQSYLFMILAPTGSAAALVSGSTYHSILGFRGGGETTGTGINESMGALGSIRDRLKNVEYVFLDEISMVDCGDMYNISSQM